MKLMKRVASAATALLMMTSLSAASFSGTDIFNTFTVTAAESTAQIQASMKSIALNEADFAALPSVSDYSEAYYDGVLMKEFDGLASRKVVEIPFEVSQNKGFSILSFDLTVPEELKILGCKKTNGKYETFNKCTVEASFKDGNNKVMVSTNSNDDTNELGTIFTLLCILPESYMSAEEYTISASASGKNVDRYSRSASVSDSVISYAKVAEDGDYVIGVGKETYSIDKLGTLADYEGRYDTATLSPDFDKEAMLNNKVVEVPVNITKNYGYNSVQLIFDYDPELVFAGCLTNEEGGIYTEIPVDVSITATARYNKVFILYGKSRDIFETSELFKLVFVLPDEIEMDHKYNISINEKKSDCINYKITTGLKRVYESGYVVINENSEPDVTEPVTPVVTEPAETEEVTTAVTEPTSVETTEATTTEATTVVTTEATTAVVTTEATTTEATTVVTTEATTTEATTAVVTTEATTTEATTTVVTTEATTTEATTVVTTEATTEAVTTTPEPEVTEPPVTTPDMPLIDIVLDPNRALNPVFDDSNKIMLEEDACIEVVSPEIMMFKGQKTIDIEVRLSDFDSSKEYFECAGFGLKLPDGFTVTAGSLKTAVTCKQSTYISASLAEIMKDQIPSEFMNAFNTFGANGGYVALFGVDTRNLEKDAVLFTLTLNVSEDVADTLHTIGIASLYGRITGADAKTHFAIINNSTETDKNYNENEARVLVGLRGDFNLDHKVTQSDATLIVREILAHDKKESIIKLSDDAVKNFGLESAKRLSAFVADVDESGIQSDDGKLKYSQSDATMLVRAILAGNSISGVKEPDEKAWNAILRK